MFPEQTAKTIRDVKGGVLINYDGTTRLLETAQVPQEHMGEFCDITKFKSFNVNSIWVRLEALKRLADAGTPIDLDIIVNPKVVEESVSSSLSKLLVQESHFSSLKGCLSAVIASSP